MHIRLSVLLLLTLVITQIAEPTLTGIDIIHYNFKISWKDALAYCRQHHVDLLRKDLVQFIYLNEASWIGLYYRSDSDEEVDSTIQIHLPHKRCALTKNVFEWQAKNCDENHPFYCYDEKVVLVKQNKTWEEALDHCRSLVGMDTNDQRCPNRDRTSDLVTLITDDDHEFARMIAEKATTAEVWTGLRFLAGAWWWVGGEPMQYNDLQSCPAVGSCGVLEKNGTARFNVRDCGERRNFLCYKRLKIQGDSNDYEGLKIGHVWDFPCS